VQKVGRYTVDVIARDSLKEINRATDAKLFFINLGGYKPGEFEEFHYKLLVAGPDKGSAILQAKQSAFYKHTGFDGAGSHVDDKYGVDVDDACEIADILPPATKAKYAIRLAVSNANEGEQDDKITLGYIRPERL
jgi:hypothetical protein